MILATPSLTVERFETLADAHPYQPKGIFYSEMFIFCRVCIEQDVTLVCESGVKHGVSTHLLAAAGMWRVVSFDFEFSILPPSGVTFVVGDARKLLPPVLAAHQDERIGVLIDGPKGDEARRLKDLCLTYEAVRVVAIHGPERGFGESLHTHDPEFAYLRRLDQRVSPEFRTAYPDGPGLSFWVKP